MYACGLPIIIIYMVTSDWINGTITDPARG
jgi:hypothetical protein